MIKILKKAETKGQCSIVPLAILLLENNVKTSKDGGKLNLLTLFSLENGIFSTLKPKFWLVSLWYHHSCVSGEILTYFDP